MSRMLINDTNTKNLGKFVATQARFNLAVKSIIEALTKKYPLDEIDVYLLESLDYEFKEPESIRWDTI